MCLYVYAKSNFQAGIQNGINRWKKAAVRQQIWWLIKVELYWKLWRNKLTYFLDNVEAFKHGKWDVLLENCRRRHVTAHSKLIFLSKNFAYNYKYTRNITSSVHHKFCLSFIVNLAVFANLLTIFDTPVQSPLFVYCYGWPNVILITHDAPFCQKGLMKEFQSV